jgi:hypothetical protein
MTEQKPHYRSGSVVGPVLLIGLGIVLLLQQTGYMTWSLWDIVSRLWPVLIIAVGADILIGRRSFLGGIVALIVVLALLAGGLFLLGRGPEVSHGAALEGERWSAPLPDAKNAEISLSPDAGALKVRSLSAEATVLLEGVFQEPRTGNVTRTNEVKNGVATIVLDDRNFGSLIWTVGDRDVLWDVSLSPDLPIALELTMGAGQIDADLRKLDLQSVEAKLGAGEVILYLPSEGEFQVDVSLGVGSVDIRVPEGMAVSIHCTTAIGNCVLPNGSGFWSQDYISEGYENASAKARINVSLAVGEATIQ